jgi:hypothetical protein
VHRSGLKISSPLPATTSCGSVQQGLSVAGGALDFFPLGLATDKRYSLEGSQLIWLGQQPAFTQRQEVIVVMDSQTLGAAAQNSPSDAYTLFEQLSGVLGKETRHEIDAQLAAMRAEWDRPVGA